MNTLKKTLKDILVTILSIIIIISFIRLLAHSYLPDVEIGKDASNGNLSDIKHEIPRLVVSAMVDRIAFCESSHNEDAYVADDGGSPSAGYLQFKKTTFAHYWKQLINKDVTEEDIDNLWQEKEHQVLLAEKMILNNPNNLKHWLLCNRSLGYIQGNSVAPFVKGLVEN